MVNISVTYLPSTEDGSPVDWNDLTLHGDVEKLGQVVRNVISNSLKFTPPDGNITIEVRKVFVKAPKSTSTPTAMVELRVTDTGAGISLVKLQLDYNNNDK